MLIDKELEMGDATAFTTAVTTAKQGTAVNVRPLVSDNATADLSAGEPLYFVIEVNAAVTSDSGATMDLQLVTAENDALTTNPVVIWSTGVQAKTFFTAGLKYVMTMPKADYKGFIGIRTIVGTAVLTAGSYTSFLAKDVANWTSTNTRTD
tara:strand:+ start:749 stop:1201 length:453 start_codon:yes stop_codon:yes gene_type:complete